MPTKTSKLNWTTELRQQLRRRPKGEAYFDEIERRFLALFAFYNLPNPEGDNAQKSWSLLAMKLANDCVPALRGFLYEEPRRGRPPEKDTPEAKEAASKLLAAVEARMATKTKRVKMHQGDIALSVLKTDKHKTLQFYYNESGDPKFGRDKLAKDLRVAQRERDRNQKYLELVEFLVRPH